MAPVIKLSYFDIAGRAEPIRLALSIGKIQFTDERLTSEQFQKLKPTLPYKQVPVITIDNVVYAQTFAILRYAGSLSGLYPGSSKPLESLRVDEFLDAVQDIAVMVGSTLYEQDKAVGAAKRQKILQESMPNLLTQLSDRLKHFSPNNNFVLCAKLSIADLFFVGILEWFKSPYLSDIPLTLIDSYPKLVALVQGVKTHPDVVKYYSNQK